ncbi:hypothetical protein RQP46_005437 [Phenoliferia psychrophenolica]
MPPKTKDEALSRQVALGIPASEHFVGALAELVFSQAISLGKDLESFAKHANRLTIGVEDVKLVARRNTSLYELLSSEANKHGLALDALKIKAPRPRAKPAAGAKKAAAAAAVKKEKEKEKGKGKGKMEVDGESGDSAEEDDADSDDSDEPALVVKKKATAGVKKAAEKKRKD